MDDSIPRQENDPLIDPRWGGVLCIIVFVSVIAQQVVIFFAGTILLLALALSWLWGRYCLTAVEYTREFSSPTVGFGEEVTLTITVVNRKLLPLSWLEIDDEAPRTVEMVRGALLPSWKVHRAILHQVVTLRWYERVTRHYRLRCPERGEQVIGPVELRSGDLFGLARRMLMLPARQTFLVYPKVVPVRALHVPSRFPLGDARAATWLFHDPLRVAGSRPYVQGDAMRQVHWKATARLGTLQVRTEDPSTMLRAMLLLNVSTTPRVWEGIHLDLLELVICVGSSLAAYLDEQRAQYGLAANTMLPQTRGYARVPVRRSPQQLAAILTVLARVTPLATTSFVDLLAIERHHLPAGATVIMITGLLDDRLLAEAYAFRSAGYPVSLVLVGDALRTAQVPGLETQWIGDEAGWRDLHEVQLTASQRSEAAPCST